MNIQYIKEIVEFMSEIMNANGFSSKKQDTGCFKGDLKAYKVAYNEEKKEFSFAVSPVDSEGVADTYTTLSTWYFDENDHGTNDTKCIAEDFLEIAAADAGFKLIRADGSAAEVALPEKAAEGTEPGIEAFAQKFLALFPQYKDNYKDSVAKYGDFLFVDFFKRYGVEKMLELMANETKNKKQLAKYWSMLGDMHYEGETIVGDVICSVILAGSFKGDVVAFNAAAEKYLSDYPFLKASGAAAVKNYKSSKKLREALAY